LPWGQAAFTLKRYRISKTKDMTLVEEKALSGDTMRLSNSLPTDTIELIVLEQK